MPKVILRSLFPTRTLYFTARVNLRDQNDRNVILQKMNITQQFEVYPGEVKPDKPCWRIRFDQERTFYFIQWNETAGVPSTKVDDMKKLAAEWLSKHEQVKTLFGPVNKNIRGEAMYSLEWEGLRNTSQADLNDKKFLVYEKFRPMEPDEKKDCAFYYGINASTLLHSQLINRMADFDTGVLMSEDIREGEKMSPMDHFLTLYGKELLTDVKLLTEKCLVHNLLTKDGKGFWFNQELIGITKENIYEYLGSNKGVVSLLKRELSKKEGTVEDDMQEEVKNNTGKPSAPKVKTEKKATNDPDAAGAMSPEEEVKQLQANDIAKEALKNLRKKATELGIKGANFMDEEKLQDKIAEKELALT